MRDPFAALRRFEAIGRVLDRVRHVHADDLAALGDPNTIEMVEVAPQTFAPKPKRRRNTTHPMGAFIGGLRDVIDEAAEEMDRATREDR